MSLRVKSWGCRGSIACPSLDHLKYGGNTTCLEIDAGGHLFILDAGTGIRELGDDIQRSDQDHVHILLTHTHWDHSNGFPFFAPAFNPNKSFEIMAGHLYDKSGVQHVFESQMENPVFPVPLEAMTAGLYFADFKAGDDINIAPNVKVRTALLNHPNDATGYRIEYGGKSVCLITDTEHIPGQPDQNILGLIEGADSVVYDSTYTEEEFPDKVGWAIRPGKRECGCARRRTSSNSAFSTTIPPMTMPSWTSWPKTPRRSGRAHSWFGKRCAEVRVIAAARSGTAVTECHACHLI